MTTTLSYFEARGLAEPIRLIFAYTGEKYEDIRAQLSIPPTIPAEIKNKCTWGQVPLVEFPDGRKLAQSLAITRFIAKKSKLVPKDDFDAAVCDEYVDACRDFLLQWMPVFMENDEVKRKEKLEEISKTAKPRFLKVFNTIVENNDGKHLVGDSLTWADIYLYHVISNVEIVTGASLFVEFPALKDLGEMVSGTAGIKEWLKKRPTTKF